MMEIDDNGNIGMSDNLESGYTIQLKENELTNLQYVKTDYEKMNNNKYSERANMHSVVPSTPNLEQYKLHNKTKPKRKQMPCSTPIQPTMQPNILHSPKLDFCSVHPERKARYYSSSNPKKRFCEICAFTYGGGDDNFYDEEQEEKRQQIQSFKSRVSQLKENIQNRQHELLQILSEQEDKYQQYFHYLHTNFESLINEIDEKHQQLNTSLIDYIQKQKQAIKGTKQVMGQIRDSIQRYVFDINRNYQGILKDLSIDNFRQIMNQYNKKIEYYRDSVLKKFHCDKISIYFPVNEMRKMVEKSTISYYDRMRSTPHYQNDRKSECKMQARKKLATNGLRKNKQNNYANGGQINQSKLSNL